MAPTIGANMKLYYNTGTTSVPVWVEVADVEDVSVPDFSRGLAELKRRGNSFIKNLPALIQSITLEFKLVHGLNSTVFDQLRQDFLSGSVREWAIMNGDITSSGKQGLRCPMLIEQFPWEQPLEEVSGHQVRLATGYMEESGAEVDPTWYVVP